MLSNTMLTLEEASKFHGHLGPFLVIGYRVGSYAMEKLKPREYKEIKCIVRCPKKPPHSCFIDGIQASTFCTLGKMNIEVEDSNCIEAIFITRERTLDIKVNENIVKKFLNLSLEEGSREANEVEFSLLAEVKER